MAESYIERLQRERDELVKAIVAVMEFHEARGNYDNSPYKFDAAKVVNEKRDIWLAKLSQVEPLLKGGK